jgi:hypothetical protein
MYELLLRTETLLQGLTTAALLGVGLGTLLVGLVFWLGGTRYSAAITGLLGAVVGSAAGLLVSQRFDLQPWLGMLVGAAVLAGLAILLRNVLVLVLAVLVFSAVSGTGYLAVVLDRAVPQISAEAEQQRQPTIRHFRDMDAAGRQDYMNDISKEADTFGARLDALLADTWAAIRPYGWMVLLAIVAGAVIGGLLVWFVAKLVIALAYSIVGTALLFVGLQAALLAAGFAAVSALADHPRVLPLTFLVMAVLGWLWQLSYGRRRKREKEPSPPVEKAG